MKQPRLLGGVLHQLHLLLVRHVMGHHVQQAQNRCRRPYFGFQTADQIRPMGQRMFGSHQMECEWAQADRQSSK